VNTRRLTTDQTPQRDYATGGFKTNCNLVLAVRRRCDDYQCWVGRAECRRRAQLASALPADPRVSELPLELQLRPHRKTHTSTHSCPVCSYGLRWRLVARRDSLRW
jgi:hypothetical protein